MKEWLQKGKTHGELLMDADKAMVCVPALNL